MSVGHKTWKPSGTGDEVYRTNRYGNAGWCRCCLGLHHKLVKREIPIDDITIDARQVDEKHLKQLMIDISERGMVQPILVSNAFHLVDGIHRYMAHRKLKRSTILCYVVVLIGGNIKDETL